MGRDEAGSTGWKASAVRLSARIIELAAITTRKAWSLTVSSQYAVIDNVRLSTLHASMLIRTPVRDASAVSNPSGDCIACIVNGMIA